MAQKEKSMSLSGLTVYNTFIMPNFAGDPQRAAVEAQLGKDESCIRFTGKKQTSPHQYEIFLELTPSQNASHLTGEYELYFPDEPQALNKFTGSVLVTSSFKDEKTVNLNPTGALFTRQVWNLSVEEN